MGERCLGNKNFCPFFIGMSQNGEIIEKKQSKNWSLAQSVRLENLSLATA
jgi:hypothetical protein